MKLPEVMAEAGVACADVEVSGLAYYRLRRGYDAAALERWRRDLQAEAANREELHVYLRHEPEAPELAASVLSR